MEPNKILQLLEKCEEKNRYEVRLRAASSLLFKLSHGLVDEVAVKTQPFFLRSVIRALAEITASMASKAADALKAEEEFVFAVLQTIDYFADTPTAKTVAAEECSLILNKLYYITTIQTISLKIKKRVELSIDQLNSVKSLVGASPAQEDKISSIPEFTMGSTHAFDALTQSHTESAPVNIPVTIGSGAGSIMHTQTVQRGWKFPYVLLVDVDEKYLFDVEVKLKLCHETAGRLLLDVMTDFPAEVIVQRSGLLQAVLDCISAPFTSVDYESDPYGCHAITCLKALHILIRKIEQAYTVFLDGGLVSSTIDLQAPREGESDPLDIVRSVMELRYPTIRHSQDTVRQQIVAEECFPRPSLSGVAFAILAATLPLLRGRDVNVQLQVSSLARSAVKYVLEYSENTSMLAALDANDENHIFSLNVKRMQHIISRFDQLSELLQPSVNFDDFFHAINDNVSEHGFSDDSSRFLLDASSRYNFVQLLLDVLREIVLYSEAQGLLDRLKFGVNIKNVLVQLLLEPQRYRVVLSRPHEELTQKILAQFFPQDLQRALYLQQLSQSFAFFSASERMRTQSSEEVENVKETTREGEDELFFWLQSLLTETERATDLCERDCPVQMLPLEMLRAVPLLLCVAASVEEPALHTESETIVSRTVNVLRRVLCTGKRRAVHTLLTALLQHVQTIFPFQRLVRGDSTQGNARTERDDVSTHRETDTRFQGRSAIERRLLVEMDRERLRFHSKSIADVCASPEFIAILCWLSLSDSEEEDAEPRTEAETETHSEATERECLSLSVSHLATRMLVFAAQSALLSQRSLTTLVSDDDEMDPVRSLSWLKAVLWKCESEKNFNNKSNTRNRDRQHMFITEEDEENDNNSLDSGLDVIARLVARWEDSLFTAHTAERVSARESESERQRQRERCFDEYAKTLVAGLFHTDSSVRCESVLLLKHHLLLTYRETDTERKSDTESERELDFWSRTSPLCVSLSESWSAASSFPRSLSSPSRRATGAITTQHIAHTHIDVPTSTTPTKSPNKKNKSKQLLSPLSLQRTQFSHNDLHKLCVLVWDVSMDAHIRGSAMQQLRETLCADRELLLTCSLSWTLSLLRDLLSLTERFVFPSLYNSDNHTSTQTRTQYVIAREAVLAWKKTDCDLVTHALHLFHHILCAYPGVLSHIVLLPTQPSHTTHAAHSSATQRKPERVNITSLLHLAFASECALCETASVLCEGNKLLRRALFLSLACVHVTVFEAGRWVIPCPPPRWTQHYALCECVGEEGGRMREIITGEGEEEEERKKVIPHFLTRSFRCLSFARDASQLLCEDALSLQNVVCYRMGRLECSPVVKMSFPPQNMIAQALRDSHVPSQHSVEVAMVTCIFDHLIHADTHTRLYQSVLLARSLRALRDSLDVTFVSLRISLASALAHILTRTPHNTRDKFLFSECVALLCEHLSALCDHATWHIHTSLSETTLSTLLMCVQTLCETLSALPSHLRPSSLTHTVTVEREGVGCARSVALHTAMHTETCKLLSVVASFPTQHSPTTETHTLHEVLLEHGRDLLYFLLYEVLYCEESWRFARGLVCSIFERLVASHDGVRILSVVDAHARERYTLTHPHVHPHAVQRLIRCAKLLRVPDSFQQTHITVHTLSLLLSVLHSEHAHTTLLPHTSSQAHTPTHALSHTLTQGELWQWTNRLLYDRRAEVRALVTEIVRVLLPRCVLSVGLLTDTHTDTHTDANNTDTTSERECEDDSANASVSVSVRCVEEQWPPLSQLSQIASDRCEAPLVRAHSLRVLASALCDEQAQWTHTHAHTHNVMAKYAQKVLSLLTELLETHTHTPLSHTRLHTHHSQRSHTRTHASLSHTASSHTSLLVLCEITQLLLRNSQRCVDLRALCASRVWPLLTRLWSDSLSPTHALSPYATHAHTHAGWLLNALTRVGLIDAEQESVFRHRALSHNKHSPRNTTTEDHETPHNAHTQHPLLRQFCAHTLRETRSVSLSVSELFMCVSLSVDRSLVRYATQHSALCACLTHALDTLFSRVSDEGDGGDSERCVSDVCELWRDVSVTRAVLDLMCGVFSPRESVRLFFPTQRTHTPRAPLTEDTEDAHTPDSVAVRESLEVVLYALRRGLRSINAFLQRGSGEEVLTLVLYFVRSVARFVVWTLQDDLLCEALSITPHNANAQAAAEEEHLLDTSSDNASLQTNTPFMGLFDEFLRLRASLQTVSARGAVLTSVLTQTDVALSVATERSAHCRAALTRFLSTHTAHTTHTEHTAHTTHREHTAHTSDSVCESEYEDAEARERLVSFYTDTVIEAAKLTQNTEHDLTTTTTEKPVAQKKPVRGGSLSHTLTRTRVQKESDDKSHASSISSLSTNKWRTRARDYEWKQSSSTKPKGVSVCELSDDVRRSLWRSLLVLKNVLGPLAESGLDAQRVESLFLSLCTLLRALSPFALQARLALSSAQAQTPIETHTPSEGSLLVALWSLLVSLCHHSVLTQSLVLRYYTQATRGTYSTLKSHPQTDSHAQTQSSGLLHWLVSIGVSHGFSSSYRWLALQLSASLLSSPHSQSTQHTQHTHASIPPAQRISLSRTLAVEIQRLLHSHGGGGEKGRGDTGSVCVGANGGVSSVSVCVYHLLVSLTAFLSPSGSSGGAVSCFTQTPSLSPSLSRTLSHHAHSHSKEKERDTQLVSLSELLQWAVQRCSGCVYVETAVCRTIGMLASAHTQSSASSLSHTICSEEIVAFLCRCLLRPFPSATPTTTATTHNDVWLSQLRSALCVCEAAACALWRALQQSEKARAAAKAHWANVGADLSALSARVNTAVRTLLADEKEFREEEGEVVSRSLPQALQALAALLQ